MQLQSLILEPQRLAESLDKALFVKANRHSVKSFSLAMLAGLCIGLGGQGYLATTTGTGVTPPTVVLGSVVFSFALIAIVGFGAELFTGNCMMTMGLLSGHVEPLELLINWGLVYSGNFVGCALTAVLIFCTGVLGYQGSYTATGVHLCDVADKKAKERPHEMFVRGIFANILVCSGVLLSIGGTSQIGRIFAIYSALVIFITCGFEHCVANMYYLSAATILGCDSDYHGHYWLQLVLSSLGNIVGGTVLAFSLWFSFMRQPADGVRSPKTLPDHMKNPPVAPRPQEPTSS